MDVRISADVLLNVVGRHLQDFQVCQNVQCATLQIQGCCSGENARMQVGNAVGSQTPVNKHPSTRTFRFVKMFGCRVLLNATTGLSGAKCSDFVILQESKKVKLDQPFWLKLVVQNDLKMLGNVLFVLTNASRLLFRWTCPDAGW